MAYPNSSTPWKRLLPGEDLFQGVDEFGYAIPYRIPDLVEIDPIVAVDQPIAHADDPGPRDLWMRFLSSLRYLSRCFADHRQVECDCLARLIVGFELFASSLP